jgi:outer membrane protein OmpA-like peptidoglycan-associated protein
MKTQLTSLLLLLPIFNLLLAQAGQEIKQPLQNAEVFFDFGKHDLRPEANSTLLQIASEARNLKNFEIKITAHTDSIGTLKNNMALSQRRADTVKKFLVARGIPAEKFSVAFFGETQPADENATEQGRQNNRRATIQVFPTIPLITIEGTVVDEKTGKTLVADVIIHTKDSRDSIRTDASGYFKKSFPAETVVGLDAFAECYFLRSEMVKAIPGVKPVKIPLKPALTGEKVDIENLYFVGDQAVLLPESQPELPKILRFMQLSPKMKIEIAGHVNFPNRPAVVEESFEYKLSVARAKMVYDYLIENKIAADRISYKGYGNWEMRFPRALTEEEHAMNRRVEIRVLDAGCQ